MTETVHNDYEVASESAIRHWEIPYARLSDATPTPTNPARVIGLPVGSEVCGTILTIDAGRSVAVIDFTCSMVYMFDVRTVTTYFGAAESAWRAIAIGDLVYYDNSATMPAGVYLSLAAANAAVVVNTPFGHIVPANDADMALFPKGGGIAATVRTSVMQMGAG
jgi:hypothetical protein